MKYWPLCVALGAVMCCLGDAKTKFAEKKLAKQLMDRYGGVEGRPLKNPSRSIDVSFSLTPIQIIKVDLEKDLMETVVWMNMQWKDRQLTWKPKNWGTDVIRLNPDKLFKPDIVPLNIVEPITCLGRRSAVVLPNGNVNTVQPVRLTTHCATPRRYTERLTCSIRFGSWTYDESKIDITEHGLHLDLNSYVPNQHWKIIDSKAKRNEVTYRNQSNPFVEVEFSFTLEEYDSSQVVQQD